MLINISISIVQTRTPDVDADEMSNNSRSPSLILDSVGSTTNAVESPTDLLVASH